MRVALSALLLLCAARASAESTRDPLIALLSDYTAPAAGQERKLAKAEADLSLIARGLETFRHPTHYDRLKSAIVPDMDAKSRPFFETRESALNALYRTLAVIDFTWATRETENPCSAEDRRAALLRSPDHLFADDDGTISPWLASVLNVEKAGTPSAALTKAGRELSTREARLARIYRLTSELANAEPRKRAGLLCERAQLYDSVAGTPSASPARTNDLASVAFIRQAGRVGAAVLLRADGKARLLTSAALVEAGTSVELLWRDGSRETVNVIRVDNKLGLAELETSKPPSSALTLAESAAGDVVESIGHPAQGGPWTRSRGLATSPGGSFHTDAVFNRGQVGGAVLDLDGNLVGIAVEPVGTVLSASSIERLLKGEAFELPEVEATDSGTGAILTAAHPFDLEATAAGGDLPAATPTDAPIEAAVGHSCVWNCGGSAPPSYGYSGGGASPLGMAMAQGLTRMFEGLGRWLASPPKPRPVLQAGPSAAPSAVITPQQRQESAPPPAPPDPLKAYGVAFRAANRFPDEGTETTLFAEVLFHGKDGSKAGIPVTFSATSNSQFVQFPDGTSAQTGPDGIARLRIVLVADKIEQQFDDLKREERRHREDAPPDQPVDHPRSIAAIPTEATPNDRTQARALAAFDDLSAQGEPEGAVEQHGVSEAAVAVPAQTKRAARYHVDLRASAAGFPAALGLDAMVAKAHFNKQQAPRPKEETNEEQDANDCQKTATKWQIKAARIDDPEQLKKEFGREPVSLFDLCVCKNKEIAIRRKRCIGEMDRTGYFIQ